MFIQKPRVKTWGFSSASIMVIPTYVHPAGRQKKMGQDNPTPVDES